MQKKDVDPKITDDSVPRNMYQKSDYGLYKDDFEASRRREAHAGDYNNISRKFNQTGNSLSKDKAFDATKAPVFKKKTGEQEVNPHNLHSKSVEVPEPISHA